MKHNPWLKLYCKDWLTDPKLRACSSAQRGTLMDLMCIAHDSDPYGQCMPDMSTDSIRMTAKLLSLSRRTFVNHLQGLIQMERILESDDGSLFIKRMVEDHAYRLKQSGLGSRGGNPTLMGSHKPEHSRTDQYADKDQIAMRESDEDYRRLTDNAQFADLSALQWRTIVRAFAHVDKAKVVDDLLVAAIAEGRVSNSGSMVRAFFRKADTPVRDDREARRLEAERAVTIT